MERESPAPAAAQIETLQQENARLRAQLAAMQQLALAPREPMNLAQRRWVGRSIQLLLVLFGMAVGAAYVQYSDADVIRGARDGWNDAARR
jgi:hypothetical protein